mgnify:CR=1 FL=1
MDVASLQTAGLSSGSIVVLFILYRLWAASVGRRIVSDCCGRRLEVGVAVRDMPTTPETNLEKIKAPVTVDAAEAKGSPA